MQSAHNARLRELEQRRSEVEQAERRCERALEQLDAVDDLDVPALRAEFERLAERADGLAGEAETLRRERDELIRDAKGLEDRVATIRGQADTHRRRAAALPLDGAGPSPAPGSLPELTERLLVSERLLESRISDASCALAWPAPRRAPPRCAPTSSAPAEAVRERARALAGSGAGIDADALSQGRREAKESYERALRRRGEAATVEEQAAERLYAANEALAPADRTREPKLLSLLTPSRRSCSRRGPARRAGRAARRARGRGRRGAREARRRRRLGGVRPRRPARQAVRGGYRLSVPDRVRPRPPPAAAARGGIRAQERRPPLRRRAAGVGAPPRTDLRAGGRGREGRWAGETRPGDLPRQPVADRLPRIDDAVAAADERIQRGITAPLRGGARAAGGAERLEGELRTRAGELYRIVGELERHLQALVFWLLAVSAEGVRQLDKVAASRTLPRIGVARRLVGQPVRARPPQRSRRRRRARDPPSAACSTRRSPATPGPARPRPRLRRDDGAAARRPQVTVLKAHPLADGRYLPMEVFGPEFSTAKS